MIKDSNVQFRIDKKQNQEILIVSIVTLLFGIMIFIVSLLFFKVKLLNDYSKFLVIYGLSGTLALIGVIILIAYYFELKYRATLDENEIKIINGNGKTKTLIEFSSIDEIIYCKDRKKARKYWNQVEPKDRPYGSYSDNQIIISLKGPIILKGIKFDQFKYVLLTIEEHLEFMDEMKRRRIKTKMDL